MKKGIYIAILVVLYFNTMISQDLVLNEIMSDNEITLADFEGDFEDWIEIHNTSENSIDLSDFYLSDNQNDLFKWNFPSFILSPNSYLVVFASDNSSGNELYTNFKISKDGEAIYLSNSGGIIHQLESTCIPEDQVAIWNGEEERFYYSENTTPGEENDDLFLFPTKNELIISNEGGFYKNPVEVDIESDGSYEVYFTLNGSEPNVESQIWTEPLVMVSSEIKDSDITHIPTSKDWITPEQTKTKAPTLRANTSYFNCKTSSPIGETYFIGNEYIPESDALIYSLQIDRKDFFSDSSGIYVQGLNDNYFGEGSFWTRKGNLEIFESNGDPILSQEIDTKNRGAGVRFKPQKSLRFIAKKKYNHPLFEHQIFPERPFQSYKKLNLRPASADFNNSIFSDALSAAVVRGLNLDFQESRLSLLYINGEYWGIHDTRENFDEEYLEQHYSVDDDDITILKNNAFEIEGSNSDYLNLVSYIQTNDLYKTEHYDYVSNLMDIDNYIDYNLSHIYMGNWDWPQNNVEIWNTGADSTKFRWFFFDCDACFYKESVSSLSQFDDPTTNDWDKIILSNLLENDAFKSKFTLRYYTLMNGAFDPENVLLKIDSLENLYAPLITDQIQRWNRPNSIQDWREEVNEMRSFALSRPQEVLDFIQIQLGNPLKLFPNPAIDVLYLDFAENLENLNFKIYDAQGKQISNIIPYLNQGIFVGDLTPGIYIIQFQIGTISYNDRFIKM